VCECFINLLYELIFTV